MPRLKLGVDLNKCINFNQAESKVTFTMPSSMGLMTQFTMAAWIKPRNLSRPSAVSRRIFEVDDGGFTTRVIRMMVGDETAATQGFRATIGHTTTAADASTGVGTIKKNEWQRVLFTWDDADNLPKLYINGTLYPGVATANKNGSRASNTGATGYIGNDKNNTANDGNFDGLIDEFCVWNRVLTAQEIQDDYANADIPSSGLVLRYQMDEASGNLSDASGGGTTGTPANVTQNVTSFSNNRVAA